MPGHYKNWLGNDLCAECALGKYNAMVQATACASCALATENQEVFALALLSEFPELRSSVSNVSLLSIVNSTVFESNATTSIGSVSVLQCVCEEGHEPSEHSSSLRYCRSCKPGSFQELPAHALCSYCGASSFSHGHSLLHHYGQEGVGAKDSTHCLPCPAFSGQDENLVGPDKLIMNNALTCMCFRGHELTAQGCRNCSEYMIQPLFANAACTFCPAGHYFVARHLPCQLCDVPQDSGDRHVGIVLNSVNKSFTWGVNEDDCGCRAGFQRSIIGLCEACPVGKFRSDTTSKHCSLCPQDTFQDSVAQLACKLCPAHASTLSQPGSTALSQCVCGPGFQPLSVQGVCSACEAGTFRSVRLHNESDAQCMPCPVNHYCEAGAIQPLACVSGEESIQSSQSISDCKCTAGFGRLTSDLASACAVCPLGFYSEANSNLECTQCPANKTTLLTATTNKTLCVCLPAHGIVDADPSSPCVRCTTGFFAHGFVNQPCTSCGWGTVSVSTQFTNFDTCRCGAGLRET